MIGSDTSFSARKSRITKFYRRFKMTDFNGKLSVVCAAVGTAGAAVAEALGGWDNAVITLIIFMVIDYAMGLIVA